MARRSRTSPLEDLVDLTARLPWWSGIMLAVVAYAALHYMATPEVAGPRMSVLQYAVPLALLVGVGILAVIRHKRAGLADRTAHAAQISALHAMTWQEFEALVGEGFKLQGYAVVERGGKGPDGGADLTLEKGTEKTLVQCKQWRAAKVTVQTVRELYGVMMAERADHGVVVTSGQFTTEARQFARGRNIELMDGHKVLALLDKIRDTVRKQPQALNPDCPYCGKTMLKRRARQGANAGQYFWGCRAYPACRGTRPLAEG